VPCEAGAAVILGDLPGSDLSKRTAKLDTDGFQVAAAASTSRNETAVSELIESTVVDILEKIALRSA
jgi:hypothetical protein